MSHAPTPIEPDPTATPARHHSRGFWRRDLLIWGLVLVVLAILATWRLSTTGRGPGDADAQYPAAVGLGSRDTPAPPPAGSAARLDLGELLR